jgi:lysine-specific demethylase/histidyl-hydroxylase NO66
VISLVDLVGDPHAFERDHWGRRPLLRRSQLDFRDLLDVEAVERLLLTSARRPTFRLVQDGRTLPPERSTSPVPMGGTSLDDVADVAKVADAVGAGATLVLQALQRTWPPLIDLCRRLERELSHPVQANAYLTPAGASGLARHADDHDVLVLQLTGRKAWDVAILGGITMTAGDVLYLPAGTEHAATAQDDMSLHLTLGIHRVTYAQVVQRALRQVEGAELTAPLPIGFAAPERDGGLAALLADRLDIAAGALRSLDALQVARREQQRARTRRAPLGAGRLASTLAADDLDLSTAVVAPADHPADLGAPAADGRIVLHLRDREVHLPPATRPALDCLLAGDPVKVGELPGLSDASRLVVARRLVREGWLLVAG